MTFTYKLSRRLAILRLLVCGAGVLITGCDSSATDEAMGPSDTSLSRTSTLQRLRITPDSLILEIGQVGPFEAYSVSPKGDTAATSVTWSATGGTISSTGLFSSTKAGSFKVIGRRKYRVLVADTSTIIVVPPQPAVVQLSITPDSATIASGQTGTFAAEGKLSDGSTQPVGVAWQATGGSIDPSGVYKAGPTAGHYRVIATNTAGTLADTATVEIPAAPAPPPAPVATRLVLVPDSLSLLVGQSRQFAAYGRTATGDSLAVAATFTATGGSITPAGLYTAASTTGSFRVIAVLTAAGIADTARVTIASSTPPPGPNLSGWYVAPNGTSGNAGTSASPWSLAYALGGAGGRIQPGNTVWVRSGTYQGTFSATLNGTSSSPITVRAYPGERAAINGPLTVLGAYTWIWGLEIYQSNPVGTSQIGLSAYGVGTKLINNVVHDAGMSGIGFWWNTQGSEAYGNIVYNNGTHNNLDHGIYFNNRGPEVKRLTDNVVFNNWAYGLHAYSPTTGELNDLRLDGNVTFGAHGIGAYVSPDLMVGGSAVQRLQVLNHRSYKPDGFTSVDLGYAGGSAQNGSVTVTGGYFVGSPALQLNRWSTANETSTTEVSYASKPTTGTLVTVEPNAYENGRGHVVIYNWGLAGSVSVNLSSVLAVGQAYTIHSVCDLFGNPVTSGTYDGGSVAISMARIPPPPVIGRTPGRPLVSCGDRFGVFVVQGE